MYSSRKVLRNLVVHLEEKAGPYSGTVFNDLIQDYVLSVRDPIKDYRHEFSGMDPRLAAARLGSADTTPHGSRVVRMSANVRRTSFRSNHINYHHI